MRRLCGASGQTSPLAPCPPPATIQFTSTVPPGNTYLWNFGDGSPTVNTANPSHTYFSHRVDTVSLIITNANGCKDTIIGYDTIRNLLSGAFANDSFGCIPLPVSFFTINQTNVPSSQTYPFPVTSYTWNFGDGSPTSSSATPNHTYSILGTYHAWVTMTFSNGCSVTDSIHITVGTPVTPSFVDSPNHICAGRSVHFFSTSPPTASILWTFGDSLTSISNPTDHIYIRPGIFTVTLYTFNSGCADSVQKTVTVDSPAALFPITYLCDSSHRGVMLADSAIGATSFLWIFSDGATSTLANPVHYFPSLGTWTAELTTYNSASGCRDSLTKSIDLYNLNFALSINDTAICTGDTVTLTPSISGGPYQFYYWGISHVYMDTTFGPPVPVTHVFNNRGVFDIELFAIDGHGCLDTFARLSYMTVARPIDSFYATPPVGCRPLSVLFTDSSKDVPGTYIVSHYWNFGDATSPVVVSPDTVSHLYLNNGTYSVLEIVTDNIGCKDSLFMPAYIGVHHPIAGFSVSTSFPCIGFVNTYTNTSTGGIQYSNWSFGDGNTSSLFSPNHAYASTGVYHVLLTVTDSFGCTDTSSKTLTVTKPHASFTVNDSAGICIPLVVQFTNTSNGIIGSYWFFGNGNNSLATNPVNAYTVPGSYTVQLIVVDSNGCPDTATKTVNLYGFSGSLSYAPLIGCKPLTVNFTANVGSTYSLVWDFADGSVTTPSYLLTASHTYFAPGAYVPKLIMSDSSGCSAFSLGIDTIKVDDVIIGYRTNPNPVCVHDNVQFIDTSKSLFSAISSYFWTFSDSTVSHQPGPLHVYNDTGTFAVTLIVSDNLGCTDTLSSFVVVHPLPILTVSADTVICVGDTAQLLVSGAVSYSWSPAAALTCNNCAAPQANPTTNTMYIVTGTDAFGCVSTATTNVLMKTQTTSHTSTATDICIGGSVQLSDSGAQYYSWSPAASLNNSQVPNPIASPSVTTTYTIVARQGSCFPDTNYVTVVVHPLPKVNAGSDVTLIEGNTTVLSATGNSVKYFIWNPLYGLSCDSCTDPTVNIQQTTTYTLTGISMFGCKDSDKVTVNILCDKSQVFVPNSFTPNGDGQNDVFYPRGVGIKNIISFRIYDRWGGLIFERKNISLNDESNAWDGTYKGGKPRPDVYVYVVDAICESGEEINWKGDVTIIR